MLTKFRVIVNKLFKEHLLLTNTVVYSSLLSLGDCFVQNIGFYHTHNSASDDTVHKVEYDYRRTGRVFLLGLMLGPLNHVWYKALDRVIVGKGAKVVGKKILADQFCAAPFFCSAYITGLGCLEGKDVSSCYQEWREKFFFIYVVDWFVWPPAQFVNFYFLPTQYRVVYVSFITLCWNSFLSFIKHKGSDSTFQDEVTRPSKMK